MNNPLFSLFIKLTELFSEVGLFSQIVNGAKVASHGTRAFTAFSGKREKLVFE